ncbi:MAG: ribosome-associated translation inhibitor RaiA [Clostridia bacterium]|nr:ribosome-associated translation inhibitor RaiA [Clostridia bacterium]
MDIAIRTKNIDLTPALREYVEKKLGRLDRYFSRPVSAQVAMEVSRGRHLVEVTVFLDGLLLRAEEAEADMYASVDLVIDKLLRQVRKYKTRVNRKLRRDGTVRPLIAEVEREEEEVGEATEETEEGLVRVKRFPVKPMDVEEAILQMNLLGHDFFVFRNASTDSVNVVYRRREGGYGLLQPEA